MSSCLSSKPSRDELIALARPLAARRLPYATHMRNEDDRLIEAIEAMPERERLLLSLYYEQELNLREIGAILEVSQSRVCQLHSQAVSRLRARLHEAG